MRLFLAVNLSAPMRDALIAAQNELYRRGVRGRWSKEENLHLTLAFIGEWPDPQSVLDALEEVTFSPFPLTLEGMGRYGDLWWAGTADAPALAALVRRIRRALADGGIPFDRKKFSPHITLIRRAAGELPGLRIPPVSMTVDTVSLMRSDRGKGGMIYTEVGTKGALPPRQP